MTEITKEAVDILDIEQQISDLVDVEQKSIGTDRDARDAGVWVSLAREAEAGADEYFDPEIKSAYQMHKTLVAEKKGFLEKLTAAKDRVRVNLANWIAGGRAVEGYYIKSSYKVAVTDETLVPAEYWIRVIDEAKIQEWAKQTNGKVAIPGVQVERTNVLYTGQEKGPEKKERDPERPAPPLKELLQRSLALDDSGPSPMPQIAMQRTRGKNLVEVAWIDGTLWCGFTRKGGISVYSYKEVPEAEHLKLLHSPFPDKIFTSNIKGKYSGERWS